MGNQNFFSDSAKSSKNQKRKNARIKIEKKAEYKISNSNISYPCSIIDLGSGGAALELKSTLYQGDKLEISFNLEGTKLVFPSEVIQVSGKSIRVRFLAITDVEKNLISNFIHTNFFDKEKKRN